MKNPSTDRSVSADVECLTRSKVAINPVVIPDYVPSGDKRENNPICRYEPYVITSNILIMGFFSRLSPLGM